VDPFETLGLTRRYDLDENELERRYRDLQRELHPDRHLKAPAAERVLRLQKAVEVNEAYRTLRDPQRRAESLLSLLSGAPTSAAGPERSADPELLMEMMKLRESLSEAKAARDAAAVARLAAQVEAARDDARAKLTRAFDGLPATPERAALETARALVSRLKYFQRFLEEVAVFEDDAAGHTSDTSDTSDTSE
jgi:molecular chaperone HscB